MTFNSLLFLAFFAFVLFVHHLPLPWRVRKLHLLLASYAFYMAWNPPFVALLWVSTLIDWFAARAIWRSGSPRARKLLVAASLAGNLGLLALFKYSGFLLENFVSLAALLGVEFRPAAPDLVLPIGISFYTFQTLSYTFDVYRGRIEPTDSFLDYALYVTFFPQLVAGPIVRARQFLPQCRTPRRATPASLGWGLSLLALGLFEKVVLADGFLAPVCEAIYDAQLVPSLPQAWLGSLAFAGQIYFDFAGYSLCAIGAGLCLGFALPENFRSPYAAVGFADLWRRWHVTLTTWLRDYVYFSLGGGRRGLSREELNTLITMLACGLWHGAAWTFVAWGGLNGILLGLERVLRGSFGHVRLWQRPPVQVLLGLGTFAVWTFSAALFRGRDMERAATLMASMLGLHDLGGVLARGVSGFDVAAVLSISAAMLGTQWALKNRSLHAVASRVPWWVRSVLVAAMLAAIVLMPASDRTFVYFRF